MIRFYMVVGVAAAVVLTVVVWADILKAKEPMADYLHGWTVVKNGRVVCTTPWVWGYKQEINCDL